MTCFCAHAYISTRVILSDLKKKIEFRVIVDLWHHSCVVSSVIYPTGLNRRSCECEVKNKNDSIAFFSWLVFILFVLWCRSCSHFSLHIKYIGVELPSVHGDAAVLFSSSRPCSLLWVCSAMWRQTYSASPVIMCLGLSRLGPSNRGHTHTYTHTHIFSCLLLDVISKISKLHLF